MKGLSPPTPPSVTTTRWPGGHRRGPEVTTEHSLAPQPLRSHPTPHTSIPSSSKGWDSEASRNRGGCPSVSVGTGWGLRPRGRTRPSPRAGQSLFRDDNPLPFPYPSYFLSTLRS